jgi:hypothetical protein
MILVVEQLSRDIHERVYVARREILNSVGPDVQDHVYVEASLWTSVFTGAMVSMMEDQSDKFWNIEFRG